MKKFNQNIEIKVSVDSIADKLLSTISVEEKHRELIAETVIGTLLHRSSQGIGLLYNALNGYSNDIDFKKGDEVVCNDTYYGYKMQEVDEVTTYKRDHMKIGTCRVIDVDIYREDKVRIEFDILKSDGEPDTEQKWIDHTKCSKIEAPIKTLYNQENSL